MDFDCEAPDVNHCIFSVFNQKVTGSLVLIKDYQKEMKKDALKLVFLRFRYRYNLYIL